jgi:hypothetical protein
MLPEKNLPHGYDCLRFESGSGRHMCPGFSARIDSLFVLVFASVTYVFATWFLFVSVYEGSLFVVKSVTPAYFYERMQEGSKLSKCVVPSRR